MNGHETDVAPIVWVPVDISELQPLERVRVIDRNGRIWEGFVRSDGVGRLINGALGLVLVETSKEAGGVLHTPSQVDRFYREFGW